MNPTPEANFAPLAASGPTAEDPSGRLRVVPSALGETGHAGPPLHFQSRIMQRIVEDAAVFARSSATVLITGESGTGKEVFASFIHQASRRAGSRYERVNCAALPESLMESELFGHERGAFTGAVERRIGRFEWAAGGTLLLDEISEIPLALQAKLLRVLEEAEFQRVGGNETLQGNVRVLATSNKALSQQVAEGTFRADLYHRLNVLRVELPPLRDRRDDIPLLANHFFQKFREEAPRPLVGLQASAMKRLCEYDWPGNIRQLRNFIHKTCILARRERLEVADLPELETAPRNGDVPPWMLDLSLEEIERLVILANLKRFAGSRTKTADRLGLTAKTVTNKLKGYLEEGHPLPDAA